MREVSGCLLQDKIPLGLSGFQARLNRLQGRQKPGDGGLQGSTSQGFSDLLGRQSQDSPE